MGKLIVLEGTDGSGKSTQFTMLTKRLKRERVDFRKLQFPQYLEPSSALITAIPRPTRCIRAAS